MAVKGGNISSEAAIPRLMGVKKKEFFTFSHTKKSL